MRGLYLNHALAQPYTFPFFTCRILSGGRSSPVPAGEIPLQQDAAANQHRLHQCRGHQADEGTGCNRQTCQLLSHLDSQLVTILLHPVLIWVLLPWQHCNNQQLSHLRIQLFAYY